MKGIIARIDGSQNIFIIVGIVDVNDIRMFFLQGKSLIYGFDFTWKLRPLIDSLEKAKRCPIQTRKNIAPPLSLTIYLCVSSKSLRLYLLSKYKQLKSSGKWTFPMFTPESLRQKFKSLRRDAKVSGKWTFSMFTLESLRQKLKSLRRDENSSGKMTFSVGNIKKPQAKRHFQLETSKCLRQNDISSEKQRFA